MPAEFSNHFKYQCFAKQINLSTDSIKVILMASGFVFDKDNHAVYANILSDELVGGNGYSQNTKTLANQVLTEDDTNDRAEMTADDVTWTASGGSIGPTPGAILYDDTSPDNTIIGYIDFGGEQTVTAGNTLVIEDISIRYT